MLTNRLIRLIRLEVYDASSMNSNALQFTAIQSSRNEGMRSRSRSRAGGARSEPAAARPAPEQCSRENSPSRFPEPIPAVRPGLPARRPDFDSYPFPIVGHFPPE